MDQNEFSQAERDRLTELFPLNDPDTQAVMWHMILDQRAANAASNDRDLAQFEADLMTAQKLNYFMAQCPGRFKEACRAMGFPKTRNRSLNELSRLGAPEFAAPARSWLAKQKVDATRDGRLPDALWRGALRHVLGLFKAPDPDEDEDEQTEDEELEKVEDSDHHRELARLWKELQLKESALDIAKTTFREERMAWEAERQFLIAKHERERAAWDTERKAALHDSEWWQDFAVAVVQPDRTPNEPVPPELVTKVLRAVEAARPRPAP